MDFSVKHWDGFPRHFPSALPVTTVNYIDKKSNWMRTRFNVCAFSLILRGRGEFHRLGRLWPVQAPCVITEWPGEYLEYGPTAGETWDECYIIYKADLMERLVACRFIEPTRPVWPIHDIVVVREQLDELVRFSKSAQTSGMADRVDRACERLVLETGLGQTPMGKNAPDLQAVLHEVSADLSRGIDFEEVAARRGMSLSTFRRRWAEVVNTPPARYLQELRMREACRLLVETSRPVHDVARAVGFADEFYFSRRFRQELKLAPRDYRKAYQLRQR